MRNTDKVLQGLWEKKSFDRTKLQKVFDPFDRPNSLRGLERPSRKASMYENFKKQYARFWKVYKEFKDFRYNNRLPDNKLSDALADFVRSVGDLFSYLDKAIEEGRIEGPPHKLKMDELKIIDVTVKNMEKAFKYLYDIGMYEALEKREFDLGASSTEEKAAKLFAEYLLTDGLDNPLKQLKSLNVVLDNAKYGEASEPQRVKIYMFLSGEFKKAIEKAKKM